MKDKEDDDGLPARCSCLLLDDMLTKSSNAMLGDMVKGTRRRRRRSDEEEEE